MYCRKCGKEVASGENFCKHCGSALSSSITLPDSHPPCTKASADFANIPATRQEAEAPIKPSSKKKWWVFAGVVSCVFVLVAVLAVLYASVGLSKEAAQERLDAVLESVYEESSPDNFIMATLKGNVVVSVDHIYTKKDGYIAACTVRVPDIAMLISDYIKTLPVNKDALYTDIVKQLQSHIQNAPIITDTFDVRFVKKSGEWQPVVPEDMVIFCCGNVYDLLPLIYSILEGSGN